MFTQDRRAVIDYNNYNAPSSTTADLNYDYRKTLINDDAIGVGPSIIHNYDFRAIHNHVVIPSSSDSTKTILIYDDATSMASSTLNTIFKGPTPRNFLCPQYQGPHQHGPQQQEPHQQGPH